MAESHLERAVVQTPPRATTTAKEQGSGPATGRPEWAAEWVQKRIPRRFQDATLERYRPETDSQRAALEAVRAWIDGAILQQGPMLVLTGAQGTGKSHLLYAAAVAILDAVLKIRAGSPSGGPHLPRTEAWYRLADVLRYDEKRDEVRAGIYAAQTVMIDEARPTASTAFDDTELAKLACHAYDHRVALLITTNVRPIENLMGPAAASRFRTVVVQGPDHRQNGGRS